ALQHASGAAPLPVYEFARQVQGANGDLAANRGKYAEQKLAEKPADGKGDKDVHQALDDARTKKETYDLARAALQRRDRETVQAGKLGVDLSIQTNNLRNQARL